MRHENPRPFVLELFADVKHTPGGRSMAEGKASKFYVETAPGRWFVCSATSAHHAIVLHWRAALRELVDQDAPLSLLKVQESYRVHCGREADAELIGAGIAYWSSHPITAQLVYHALETQHGEQEADRIIWDWSGEVPIRVRHLTIDQLDQA